MSIVYRCSHALASFGSISLSFNLNKIQAIQVVVCTAGYLEHEDRAQTRILTYTRTLMRCWDRPREAMAVIDIY